MIKEILEQLEEGKKLYLELIKNYNEVLPPNIIEGAHIAYNNSIPDKVNNLLAILNFVEKADNYQYIKDIDDCINLFTNNPHLQQSINLSLSEPGSIRYIINSGEEIDIIKIFDKIMFGIKDNVESFYLLIALGKLTLEKNT